MFCPAHLLKHIRDFGLNPSSTRLHLKGEVPVGPCLEGMAEKPMDPRIKSGRQPQRKREHREPRIRLEVPKEPSRAALFSGPGPRLCAACAAMCCACAAFGSRGPELLLPELPLGGDHLKLNQASNDPPVQRSRRCCATWHRPSWACMGVGSQPC